MRWREPKPQWPRSSTGSKVPGTTTRLIDKAVFLLLEESEAGDALFDLYWDGAAALGFDVGRALRADPQTRVFTAAVGAATLCATGPVGEQPHTPHQVCHIDTMVPRAKAWR